SLALSSAPSNDSVNAGARRRLRPRRVIIVSITAWMRREAPAGPPEPSLAVTVGRMPLNPLEAAASWPRAVVARAIAVAAASTCWPWPPSGGEAYRTGRGVAGSAGEAGGGGGGAAEGGRGGGGG